MAAAAPAVLVVDDERFFREAIGEALRGEGFECRFAETAAAALEQACDPRVGVVVLDLALPDRSGIEVLRVLRRERPSVRVVILSAHTEQDRVLEALRLGACDYLAKPLHEEELRLSVRRALEGHRLEARLERLRSRLGALAEALDKDRVPLAETDCPALARALGVERLSLMQLEADSRRLRVVAGVGHPEPLERLDPVALGAPVAGEVAALGAWRFVPDAAADPQLAGRSASRGYRSRSFAVAPIGANPPWGVLCATEPLGCDELAPEEAELVRLAALGLGARTGAPAGVCAPIAEAPGAEEPAVAGLALAVCEAITREVEPDTVLRAAARAASGELRAAPVSVLLLDAEGERLHVRAQWEGGGEADRDAIPATRGLTGVALASGCPVATPRPEQDPRFDPEVDTPKGSAAGPLIVAPLRFRGRPLGVVRAFPERPEAASPRLAEALAASFSAAVRSAQLCRSLLESIEELARVRREARGEG